MSTTTDRTDLLNYLPEAADCTIFEDPVRPGTWWCTHPAYPEVTGGRGIDPVSAYARFAVRLDEWQEDQKRDEIDPRDDIEGMYAAADDKGQMEREG